MPGYNAYPPQSQANVAMYAVGGLAAGAGAMHLFFYGKMRCGFVCQFLCVTVLRSLPIVFICGTVLILLS